jgi:hypothetical protein
MHRETQKLGRVRAVPRLCGHHPGICLKTEEKALQLRKKLGCNVGKRRRRNFTFMLK